MNRYLIRNHKAIRYIAAGICCGVLFALGVARYRIMVLMSFYLTLEGALTLYNINVYYLRLIGTPLMFITLLGDVQTGQLFPVYDNLSVYKSILFSIMGILFVEYLTSCFLIKATNKELFYACPKCQHRHVQLTDLCSNCSFRNTDNIAAQSKRKSFEYPSADLTSEINTYREIGIHKNISDDLVLMLDLSDDEQVLINISMFIFRACVKNDTRTAMRNFIVTTKKLIFIDYSIFKAGWREREFINLKDVAEASLTYKSLPYSIGSKIPSITIITNKDTFSIYWLKMFPDKAKVQIEGIADCINRRL